jgi:hypothetical protein
VSQVHLFIIEKCSDCSMLTRCLLFWHIAPCRWMRYVLPKRPLIVNRLHDVMPHKFFFLSQRRKMSVDVLGPSEPLPGSQSFEPRDTDNCAWVQVYSQSRICEDQGISFLENLSLSGRRMFYQERHSHISVRQPLLQQKPRHSVYRFVVANCKL